MTRKHTELYLEIEAQPAMATRLAPLMARVHPASVLIVPPPSGTLDAATVLPLIAIIQKAGAAAVVAEDARLARTVKADGVHLAWRPDLLAAYREAREIVGGRSIVGVEAGNSRHDAMSLGEAGADYIGFRPVDGSADDEDAREGRRELVAWWADIFEVPCVAFDARDADEAREMTDAGADFVGVRLAAGASLADEQTFLVDIVSALSSEHSAAAAS